MSTGYGWEGLRQVCATPLSARHVPEHLCCGLVCLGRYNKCSPLHLPFFYPYTRHFNSHFPGKSGLAGCPFGSHSSVILIWPSSRTDQISSYYPVWSIQL